MPPLNSLGKLKAPNKRSNSFDLEPPQIETLSISEKPERETAPEALPDYQEKDRNQPPPPQPEPDVEALPEYREVSKGKAVETQPEPEPEEEEWQAYDPSQWEETAPDPSEIHGSGAGPSEVGGQRNQAGEVWEAYDPKQWELPPEPTQNRSHQQDAQLDRHWINLDDIQQWMYTCDFEHAPRCQTNEEHAGARPDWVIDVQQECIVRTKPDHKYMALSYVWGEVESSETTKDNMEFYMVPGALAEGNREVIIPKTIRHAMRLVSMLEHRYLWVDRFCIIQDDAATKHSQINMMADIYENAYLTIIAGNGWDANHGLRGIQGVTEPRQLPPHFRQGAYREYLQPYNSIWYARGWTFQELFFSPRKLMFQYQMVLWECRCSVWHESTGVTGDLPGFIDDSSGGPREVYEEYKSTSADKGVRITPWKENHRDLIDPLYGYLDMVRDYNIRKLTYPEDGLSAFTGVTTRLLDRFPAGFLWGLPIQVFDVALLWHPSSDLIRREPRNPTPRIPEMPSWSWVGWEGSISRDSWDAEYHLSDDRSLLSAFNARPLIVPLCQWAYEERGVRFEIMTDYRLKIPAEAEKRAEENTVDLSPIGPLRNPLPYLTTRAEVVTCVLGSGLTFYHGHVTGSSLTKEAFTAWILSPEFITPCGIMSLSPSECQMVKGQECQLMAISRGVYTSSQFVEWEKVQRAYPNKSTGTVRGVFEYYNVLWIQKRRDIWYRHGVGMMSIEAWNQFKPQEVDIKLG